MLVRDLLQGLDAGLLEKLTLLVVPIFNPDGNDAMDTANRALAIERLNNWAKAVEGRGILLVPLTTAMTKSKSS